MCVTNNVRRPKSLAPIANPSMLASTPSVLSQRLMGNFMPMMMNNSTNSACSTAPLHMSVSSSAETLADLQNGPQAQVQKPEKVKTRRRRKPQKPGKTAKQNDRHFVVHNYHDHANDDSENDAHEFAQHRRKGGVATSFPMKLHSVLDQVEADGLGHVISWQPHGRCFVIHQPKEFTDHVMPKYFRQTKLTSFQRQLNLYGFSRLTTGKDNGGYYHELFLRGKIFLAKRMSRTKIKGTKFKAASSPDQEPNFYTMPPVIVAHNVTPPVTSDESSVEDNNIVGSSMVSPSMMPTSTMMNPSSSILDPYPILSAGNNQPIAARSMPLDFSNSQSVVPSLPQSLSNCSTSWNNNNRTPSHSTSYTAFDAAIDEVFCDDDPLDLMGEQGDLSDFFDPSMQVTERIDNDEQLGYLLEALLE